MRRQVTVTFTLDPTEYHEADDTAEGCIELAVAILREEADWSSAIHIACETKTLTLKLGDL